VSAGFGNLVETVTCLGQHMLRVSPTNMGFLCCWVKPLSKVSIVAQYYTLLLFELRLDSTSQFLHLTHLTLFMMLEFMFVFVFKQVLIIGNSY